MPILDTLPAETPTANPTDVPASSEQQARQQITALLDSNAGCKLPCFWGITPGQTTVAEAATILDAFSSVDIGSHTSQGGVMEYYFDMGTQNLPGVQIQLYSNDTMIEAMNVGSFEAPAYHLKNFLLQNGKPDQVMVRTWKSSPAETGQVPFLVYMYYKNSGMLVGYGMGNGTIVDESIHGCVDQSPSMFIWGTEKPEDVEKAMMMAGWYDPNLHSLADATNGAMDVDSFYETFSQSDSETCFDTPRNLWAEPER